MATQGGAEAASRAQGCDTAEAESSTAQRRQAETSTADVEISAAQRRQQFFDARSAADRERE